MKKRRRIYFTQDTENAIVEYNESVNPAKKSKIYENKIATPLNKLVENVINRFKFPYFKEVSEDLQADVISFLIMNMHKYQQEKGRAFSYFSILAKNYLILGNNDYYKIKKMKQRIDIPEGEYVHEIMDEEQDRILNDDVPEFVGMMVEYWDNNLSQIFTKQHEIAIANAIMTLFKHSPTIENYNKKALYLMIREMTGLKTQYITSVVNKMKEHNKLLLDEYNKEGYFDTSESIDDFMW